MEKNLRRLLDIHHYKSDTDYRGLSLRFYTPNFRLYRVKYLGTKRVPSPDSLFFNILRRISFVVICFLLKFFFTLCGNFSTAL